MKTPSRWPSVVRRLSCLLLLCLLAGCGKKDTSSNDDDDSSGGSSGGAAVDAKWVTEEFNAAIIVRPQRMIAARTLAGMGQDDIRKMLAEAGPGNFPLDPNKIESGTLLIGVGDRKRTKYNYDAKTGKESTEEVTETRPLACGVFQLTEKADREAILKKVYKTYKVVKVEGGEYYVRESKFPSRDGTYFPADKTVIVSDTATLEKILAGKHKSSALAALIAGAPGNKPIVAVGRGDDDLNKRIDAMMKTASPRDAAEFGMFVPFIKTARTLKLEADLDASELVKGTAEMVDEKAAKDLAGILNLLTDQGKTAFQKEKVGMMRGAPPELAELLPQVIEQLLAGIKVEARGSTVSLLAAAPADLAKLATAMKPTFEKQRKQAGEIKRSNNLRMIGMAIRHNQIEQRYFASNYRDPSGKPLLSWRVMILPYIDQKALFDQFKLDEPWDSPNNIKLLDQMPPELRSADESKDGDNLSKTRFQVAVGPGTPYEKGEKFDGSLIIDGMAKTLQIAEVGADKAVPWTKPEDFTFDPADPWKGVGTIKDPGMLVLYFDGHIGTLPRSTKPEVLKLLFQHADGQAVPDLDGGHDHAH